MVQALNVGEGGLETILNIVNILTHATTVYIKITHCASYLALPLQIGQSPGGV